MTDQDPQPDRTADEAKLEEGVAAARRAMFTDAVRGNGNGQIPKMR